MNINELHTLDIESDVWCNIDNIVINDIITNNQWNITFLNKKEFIYQIKIQTGKLYKFTVDLYNLSNNIFVKKYFIDEVNEIMNYFRFIERNKIFVFIKKSIIFEKLLKNINN